MSSPIREILLRGGSSLEIKDAAKKDGMKTLIEDGWRVVSTGETTPAEVLRVSKDEGAEGYLVE
jgi:general secretion pathway protein E